ncbi:hypothetical protein JCM10450v2_005605 [Rhodotorula kratochvilovae]
MAEEAEADPSDPELQRRLHSSTLKLRDAWDDILARHSLPLPSSSSASSRAASAPAPVRHRPAGRTRAIPVEEDDIIDLATMEIVQDRGVLRRSRKGAFALGGYMDTLDDVIVGVDTGAGEEGEEEDVEGSWEDEEEDEDGSAGYSTSDDELGDMDELPSLPSLLFREQRRRDAERRDQLRDFWAHEARARGASEAQPPDDDDDEPGAAGAGGNRTIDAIDEADEDDELGFFARAPSPSTSSPAPAWVARRRASSSPLEVEVVTPSRKGKEPARPPSTTAALRVGFEKVHLASSSLPVRPPESSPSAMVWQRASPPGPSKAPVSARTSLASPALKPGTACLNCRKRKRRCDALKPACGPCVKLGGDDPCVYDDARSPSRTRSLPATAMTWSPSMGIATPPASFAARKASVPPSRAMASRPPLSSSPLRDVITVASPSPSPSPSRSPSPSPAPPAQHCDRLARSPSLEILPSPAHPRLPSPELGLPAPYASQRPPPTPTPTPPPFSLPGLASSGCGARPAPSPSSSGAPAQQPKRREWRRHSFELVVEVKPRVKPRSSLLTGSEARSVSTPDLGTIALGAKSKARAGSLPEEEEEDTDDKPPPPLGLSTPPLSKRSSRPAGSTPSSASSTAARRVVAPPSSAAKALPSRILPRAVDAALDENAEDPLLLGSSPSPSKKRAMSIPVWRRATATPAAVKRAAEESEDDEDGFGAW